MIVKYHRGERVDNQLEAYYMEYVGREPLRLRTQQRDSTRLFRDFLSAHVSVALRSALDARVKY